MKKLLLFVSVITVLCIQSVLSQTSSPILETPPNLEDNVSSGNVTFRWQDLTGVLSYTIEIANDPLFSTMVGPGVTCSISEYTPPDGMLVQNTTYYWRVRGDYTSGPGPYSDVFCFTTCGSTVQEITSLNNLINGIATLSNNQRIILNNRLGQAAHQIDLGHETNAIVHLLLFDLRVSMYQYSNSLSADDANSLRDGANNVIQMLLNGNSKLSHDLSSYDLTPHEYSLGQNYPNPFNPSTSIEYNVPVTGNVTLKVYDILGKEVASLVDKQQDAGSYIVNWNASSLSSGVYFYKLTAGSFTQTKKMMLSK